MQENLCTTTNKQTGPYVHHKMTKGDIAVYVQLSRGRCIWSVNRHDLYLLLQHHWNIFSDCYLNIEFYVSCRKSVETGSFPMLLLGYPSLKRRFRKEAWEWWYYVLASLLSQQLIRWSHFSHWFLCKTQLIADDIQSFVYAMEAILMACICACEREPCSKFLIPRPNNLPSCKVCTCYMTLSCHCRVSVDCSLHITNDKGFKWCRSCRIWRRICQQIPHSIWEEYMGFQHCAIVRKRREEEFRAMPELITWSKLRFMEGDVEPQTAKQW